MSYGTFTGMAPMAMHGASRVPVAPPATMPGR
jgi:hypothetical protein